MIKPETNDFFGNELDKAKLEIVSYWKDKYEKTQKALDVAVDALKRIDDIYKLNGVGVQEGIFMGEYAHKALLAVLSPEEAQMRTLEQITALEQKDVK